MIQTFTISKNNWTIEREREREEFNRRRKKKEGKKLEFKIYYILDILELDKSVRNYSDGRENTKCRISVMFFYQHGRTRFYPPPPQSRIRSAPLTF